MDTAAITMETLLSSVGEFFGQSIEWLGDVLDTVTANPALLILVVAMPLCSFSVGLLGRLIRM